MSLYWLPEQGEIQNPYRDENFHLAVGFDCGKQSVYSAAKGVEIDKLKDDWKDTPLSKSCTIHPHCLSDDCMDCEYFHKLSDFIKQKMEEK